MFIICSGDGAFSPPANNPLVEDDAFQQIITSLTKSPKADAFPNVEIVTFDQLLL